MYRQPLAYAWLVNHPTKPVKAKGTRPYSHLCQDGAISAMGPIFVTEDIKGEFLTKYVASWRRFPLETMYMVQQGGDVSPLVMDLDIMLQGENAKDTTPEMFTALVKVVQQVISRVYDGVADDRMTMLSGWTALTYKEKEKKHKIGAHFHWPELFVTQQYRLALRKLVLQQVKGTADLKKVSDGIEIANEWDDVFDYNVAKNNNIRMFGSSKIEKCSCKSAGFDRMKCMSQGHVKGYEDKGRRYEATCVYVYKHNGVRDYGKEALYRPMPADSEDVVCQKLLKLLQDVDITRPCNKDNVTKANFTDHDLKDATKKRPATKIPKALAEKQDEVTQAILNLLAMYCPLYEPIDSSITIESSQILVQFKTQFCSNKGGNHNGVAQYATITPDRLVVRCYCGHEEKRIFDQPCRHVQSCWSPLPERLVAFLFPRRQGNATQRQQKNKKSRITLSDYVDDQQRPGVRLGRSILEKVYERVYYNEAPVSLDDSEHIGSDDVA